MHMLVWQVQVQNKNQTIWINDKLYRPTVYLSKVYVKVVRLISTRVRREKVINMIKSMSLDEICNIPKDRTVIYERIFCDYWTPKYNPNWVKITVGSNIIDFPGDLTTLTVDLITTKYFWNRTISILEEAVHVFVHQYLFYLETTFNLYE